MMIGIRSRCSWPIWGAACCCFGRMPRRCRRTSPHRRGSSACRRTPPCRTCQPDTGSLQRLLKGDANVLVNCCWCFLCSLEGFLPIRERTRRMHEDLMFVRAWFEVYVLSEEWQWGKLSRSHAGLVWSNETFLMIKKLLFSVVHYLEYK